MYTTFESTVSYSVSRLPDDIKIIDPMNGTVYDLPEDMIENLGNGHIKLKNVPLLDYPLFITFGEFC